MTDRLDRPGINQSENLVSNFQLRREALRLAHLKMLPTIYEPGVGVEVTKCAVPSIAH